MLSKRLGLLIATTGYADPQLPAVPGGATHIGELAEVLQSPQVGGFSLTVLVDPTLETARAGITTLLAACQPDDLVLLYVLGHCIRQTSNALFLALRETNRLDFENTALPAAFVQQQLQEAAAKKQIIILDSLLGSVVSAETPLHRDSPLNVRLDFSVPNRRQAILAASDYLSFCLVGEHYVPVRSAQPPVAESIVRGLQSRAADENGEGQVTVNALVKYLKYVGSGRQDEMRVGWTAEAAGDLIIATYPDASGQNKELSATQQVTPATAPPAVGPSLTDDNVRFTLYRPAILVPGKWRRLMVFMHLDEAATRKAMEARARQILSADSYGSVIIGESNGYRDAGRVPIGQDDDITLIPEVPGIRFNPPRRSFSWETGSRMHEESFFVYAPFSLTDQSAHGRVSVFFKQLLLAEIALDLRVAKDSTFQEKSLAKGVDRRFRKVFASYSDRDSEVVAAMDRFQTAGNEYLRKVVSLRSGQQSSEELAAMIADAEVFQLFWSRNAAQSAQIEKEWRHAITLQREAFVRPAYWEVPMPEAPEPLRGLRFSFLPGIHPTIDRRKEKGAAVENQRGSADKLPIPDVVPPGKETQTARAGGSSSPALASTTTQDEPAEVRRKRSFPVLALFGTVIGGCLLIYFSINTISRTFLKARHPVTHSVTPTPQATPSARVETPILALPTPTPILTVATPSPSQPLATPSPSPAQALATPSPSPAQALATPSPSPAQALATPSSTVAAPTAVPSVTPTDTASPEPTASEKPADRGRHRWHRRPHHRARNAANLEPGD